MIAKISAFLGASIKFVFLVGLIIFVLWVGLSFYSCYNSQSAPEPIGPTKEEARYSALIMNTRSMIFTDSYSLVSGCG